MIYLLDANVLIAMVDQDHIHHDIAQDWFERTGQFGWATCPITENALLRIAGRSSYPLEGTPATIADILAVIRDLPNHVFWSDDISLVASEIVNPKQLLTSGQVTDTYLLALAVRNNGALATLDRRLSPRAVRGGDKALHFIQ